MAKNFPLIACILLFAAVALSGCISNSEEQLRERIEQANYCNAKEDCVALDFPTPYCILLADSLKPPFLVNKAKGQEITALLEEFCKPSNSYVGMIGIIAYCDDPLFKCEDGKCVGYCPQNIGEYCENSSQCFQVVCPESPYYPVCEENKCGCLSPPGDEIKAVRSIQLPAGWQVAVKPGSDWDEKAVAIAQFSNPDKLCKVMAMGSVLDREENPGVSVDFYKKEFAEELRSEATAAFIPYVETKNYIVSFSRSFTSCREDQDERDLLERICLALEPFVVEKDIDWGWYCEQ